MIPDRLVDLHVHSSASDGALDLAALVELADRRGVRLGIADHVGPDHPIASGARLHEHLDELADYPVLRGVELELGEEFDLSRALLKRLDYVIGGLHAVKVLGRTVFLEEGRPGDVEPDALVEAIVCRLVEAMESEPLDVLAHPTLLPPPLRLRAAELFHDEHLDRIGRAAAECDVALEVTGRLRLPHERAVERWLAAGARLALGSDAHAAADVGDLAYPLDVIERFRVGPRQLYSGRRD